MSRIEVVELDYYNIDKAQVETLRLTSSPDYFFNGQAYIPVLSEKLDFEGTLFDKGTTSGDISVNVGTISFDNIDGRFDAFRQYAFDGREARIYRPATKDEPLSTDNLKLTAIIKYPEFAWAKCSFNLVGRMEVLNVPMQSFTLNGTNAGTGGAGELEGSSNVKGQIKPQTWGRVANVEGALINEFFLIYSFNCNALDGSFRAVDNFYNVFVKGIRYYFYADYADSTALTVATIPSGYYGSCKALGLIRLGSVPADNGAVVADVADYADPACTIAQVVKRILETNLSFIAGQDYDSGSLQLLDSLNTCPVGIYIDDETTVGSAVTQLLDSGGFWMAPDVSGMFYFGQLDLVAKIKALGQASICTITKSQWGEGIERISVDDAGQNVPAYCVRLQHTRTWKTQESGSLADAVGMGAREIFSNEYRLEESTNPLIQVAHPLAPMLTYKTLLMSQIYLPILNGDFHELISDAGNGWTLAGVGAGFSQSNGRIVVTPGSTAPSITQKLLVYNDGIFGGNVEFGFTVAANTTVKLTIRKGVATAYTEIVTAPVSSDLVVLRTVAWPFNPVIGDADCTIIFTGTVFTGFTISNVFARMQQQGTSPKQECDRRLAKESAFVERYQVPIPEDFFYDKDIFMGAIVTLQDPDRFELALGADFLVIGIDYDDDNLQVILDVWGER